MHFKTYKPTSKKEKVIKKFLIKEIQVSKT